MGLDMYLKKAKRVKGLTGKDIHAIDDYYDYMDRPEEYKNSTMKDWCGLTEEDFKRVKPFIPLYKDEYITRYYSWDLEHKYGRKTIIQMIGDWRKANQIHNWFVKNVQHGEDDCGAYEVTEAQLGKLLQICRTIKNNTKMVKGKVINGYTFEDGKMVPMYQDGKYMENHALAEKLLPTQDGFFFGSTEYDQWYMNDIELTIEILEKTLKDTDFEHEIVMYTSSW